MRDAFSTPVRPHRRRFPAFLAILCWTVGLPSVTAAQTSANVAVVINETSPASVEIGEYYARVRSIPDANIIRIKASAAETVSRDAYTQHIERGIGTQLLKRGLTDRILYIVLAKGVPHRITGSAGVNGTAASVDSELTLLYRRLAGQPAALVGQIDNPYFAGTNPVASAPRFNRRTFDIYLVTRLDGFSVADVRALIDRGIKPGQDGRVRLDPQGGARAAIPDGWLARASEQLGAQGHAERVDLVADGEKPDARPVLGYYSWGAADPANRTRRLGISFAPGALAATFDGTDGRTFLPPPEGWRPGVFQDRTKWFADGAQSLLGDLVAEGVTGAGGHVADPLLAGTFRPEILFPAYFAGFNLAESYYLSLPSLSWQAVVVGDPLCRPFSGTEVATADIEDGLDAATGLPAVFARRKMASIRDRFRTAPDEALPHLARAEIDLLIADRQAARKALAAAATLVPGIADVHMQLALLDEEAGEFERALEGYRRVVDLQPRNVIALNNLAYRLSTSASTLPEAREFARRAVALAPQNPQILDTLGWVHHLMGEQEEADRLISTAVRLAPDSAEIRLHAALRAFAKQAFVEADTHLKEALRLDPTFEARPEVRDLRAKLEKR